MGAAANITACIYLPTTLGQDVTFQFTSTDAKCMNSVGNSPSLLIPAGTVGISSVSIGRIESKDSGMCFGRASYWTLSYNSYYGTDPNKQTPYSGSMEAHVIYKMGGTDSIEITATQKGTLINTS